MHERRGVHRLRPAVDFEHQRPLFALAESGRLHQPAVDGLPVSAGDLERLGAGDLERFEQRVVLVAQSALLSIPQRDDFVGMCRIGNGTHHLLAVARDTEGRDFAVAADNNLWLTTAQVKSERLDAAVPRNQAEQAAAACLPGRRLRAGRVAGIRERGVAELVVKVARDRARVTTLDRHGEQLGARAVGPAALVAEIRHLASVWRKDGHPRLAAMARQTPGAAPCWAPPRRR